MEKGLEAAKEYCTSVQAKHSDFCMFSTDQTPEET
jgi:hypothetical protein